MVYGILEREEKEAEREGGVPSDNQMTPQPGGCGKSSKGAPNRPLVMTLRQGAQTCQGIQAKEIGPKETLAQHITENKGCRSLSWVSHQGALMRI